MVSIVRWALFVTIGYISQLAFMAIYPIIHLWWRIFVYKNISDSEKALPVHENIDILSGMLTRNDNIFLNNHDDHGAFSMYGFIDSRGLGQLIDEEGNFLRMRDESGSMNRSMVSGDTVVAWCFASLFKKANDEDIKKAIGNYIKYLGTRSWDKNGNNGDVSARCNNFGLNYCPDGYRGLGQPMAGPQFYTTSALLVSGYHLGLKYKVIFWLHWLLMGGWYWAMSPVIYSKKSGLWYARDIAMKSLYIHQQVLGSRWWIRVPMKQIWAGVPYYNQLFAAMMKKDIKENILKECMNPFFSQREDASSTKSDMDGRNSAYVDNAIKEIYEKSRF